MVLVGSDGSEEETAGVGPDCELSLPCHHLQNHITGEALHHWWKHLEPSTDCLHLVSALVSVLNMRTRTSRQM